MRKLPKALRLARSLIYGYQNPDNAVDSFNAGMRVNPNKGIPDAMRGSVRLTGDQSASINAIYLAAVNGDSRKRG